MAAGFAGIRQVSRKKRMGDFRRYAITQAATNGASGGNAYFKTKIAHNRITA